MDWKKVKDLPGPPAERFGQFCKICGKQIPMNKHVKFCWDCKERMKNNNLVHVVRCKDCKYGVPLTDSSYIQCSMAFHTSERHGNDWFCADGVRKDREDT